MTESTTNQKPMSAAETHSAALSEAGYRASASALEELTNQAQTLHDDPKTNLHKPADHDESHSWLSRVLPQSTITGLETRFHMGNYVLDRRTQEKTFEAMSIYVRVGMHLLYWGSAQEHALHWKRTVALLEAESIKMGKQYDDPASKAHIIPFLKSFDLEASMAEMVKPDPNDYATFNEFFAREIRLDARPPAEPENPLCLSSPADCRLSVWPTVDLATKYWIKGYGFSLEKLLGSAEFAARFDGGALAIARLAPQDYHRWHAPVSGIVRGIHEIPGAYYTVNPQAINEEGTLDVFCENRRSVMTVERTDGAPVAIVAVGAMLVGSIKYVDGVEVGAEIVRGQCLGKFLYGGSTVIVVLPKGETVFDEDLVNGSVNEKCETLVRVGERIGIKE